MNLNQSKSRKIKLFIITVLIIYLIVFFIIRKLHFPYQWDEPHYWETSLLFSHSLVPDLNKLRSYNEPNTPLPFLIFGYLEYFLHSGILGGRLLNLFLSFLIVCLVAIPKGRVNKYSLLSVFGLVVFPYYILLSTHLYTDIIATFFVLLGFWFYVQDKHILSSVAFVLAIASRQYMLAFPLAVGIFELISSLKQNKRRVNIRWLAPMLAAASILGWIWFFGGLMPQSAATIQNIPIQAPQNKLQLSWIFPDRGLYFLACIGLYFCIPECILFREWNKLGNSLNRKNLYIALGVLFLFVIFPPLDSKGILTKVVQILPSSFLQATFLYILVVLACVRFSRQDLVFWVVLMNCSILMKGYAWDKYALPAVVVLWYMKSIHALDDKSSHFLPYSQAFNVSGRSNDNADRN